MAEILLSLTIIGVVAAITLPSLTGNINERTWNTQRKALYARMTQAISLMPSLNGYGTLEEGDPNNVTETFITAGLSKVLKINNICDNEHLKDCGIVSKLTTLTGSVMSIPVTLSDLNTSLTSVEWTYPDGGASFSYSTINTNAAAFETANGESLLAYYNPRCQFYMAEKGYILWPKMCANFIYDLNGSKGPNTVGKDMGVISVFYPVDSSVVILHDMKFAGSGTWDEAVKWCRALGEDYRLPNNDELASYLINRRLIQDSVKTSWSSTIYEKDYPYYMWISGYLQPHGSMGEGHAQANCVKR